MDSNAGNFQTKGQYSHYTEIIIIGLKIKDFYVSLTSSKYPTNIYLLKVNKRNTRNNHGQNICTIFHVLAHFPSPQVNRNYHQRWMCELLHKLPND